MPTGQLREPFGDLLELARQAESRDDDELTLVGARAGRYLRSGDGWQDAKDLDAVIRRILDDRDRQETGSNEKNPTRPLVAQGSNVLLLAEATRALSNPRRLRPPE